MRISDWSSDVCSSDLKAGATKRRRPEPKAPEAELPLTPPPGDEEAPDDTQRDESAPASDPQRGEEPASSTPPLELFGKPAGFRLSQHGRHGGARNAAKPA